MQAARTIRLLISFDGTAYKGWQRQVSVPTIQGTLEEKLSLICNEKIHLHGAGRTDAGVHALGMVAHFQTTASLSLAALGRGLNSLLPADIRILNAEQVPPDFHSRMSAIAKTYRYDLYTGPVMDPTRRLYETHFPGPFNTRPVRACLQNLQGSHDFASFEGAGSRDLTKPGKRGSTRTLFQAHLVENKKNPLHFSLIFTGDGFLRHMIRNIAGTLLLAAQGKISPREFSAIIQAENREAAGPTAPANGLFLVRIYYSRQELEEQKIFL